MLLKDFINARDYWTARDPNTGETWLEFCLRTDMSVEAILKGIEVKQKLAEAEAARQGRPDTPNPFLQTPVKALR